jgi:3-phosphoshikimate 1-carboxyvinyltransferase
VVSTLATTTVAPADRIAGTVRLPGDKSISHRYALLAALADGPTVLTHYAPGADCLATLSCLAALGVAIERHGAEIHIEGRGLRGLAPPPGVLDCGNSGSTLRMLAGVLAAHGFTATLSGDASLCRRPMRRIITPLERMGARVAAHGDRPPLTVTGGALEGIDVVPEVPSAQVKSAILLAGLQARGETTVREMAPTRDHTERALEAFGAAVRREGLAVTLAGGQRLRGGRFAIPGDVSSAAFWAAAAAALPGSRVELVEVGLNPTRTAFLDVLARAGAQVRVETTGVWSGEPIGRVTIAAGSPRPLVIEPAEVPGLIDELPALAAWAALAGEIEVSGAGELRAKESDRISALVAGLRALGVEAEERPDGFRVRGGRRPPGGTADACGDHRLAMAFALVALGARGPSTLRGAESVGVSYPAFFEVLDALRA